ncbi:MAG: hypothetical protein JSR67_11320 [Proteobacteria bacterium]|nr:hypothetical protein [Pseudomonadota bacterium]
MTGAGTPGFDPAAAFTSAARQFLGLLQSLGAGRAGAQPWNPAATAAALAGQFEQWLRAAQFSGSWPGSDATAAAGSAEATTAWLRGLNSAAGAPGATQWQQQVQQLWELLQRIATLQAQLSPYWSEIATEAGRRFTAQPGAARRRPPSLQEALQIYERWVECAEGAYAATVHRPDFCHLQAQLINASAALLAWQRSHAQTLQQAFGLPVTAPRKTAKSRKDVRAAKTSRAGRARKPTGTRRRRQS